MTAPIARPAGDRSFAGRRTVPAASVASLMAAHIHLLIGAEDRLLKFEREVFAKVGSALGAAATASALAEHVAETENVAEDVPEILEDGGIESRGTSGASGEARVSAA